MLHVVQPAPDPHVVPPIDREHVVNDASDGLVNKYIQDPGQIIEKRYWKGNV